MIDLYRLFNDDGDLLYVGISWNAVARYGSGHKIMKSWAREVASMTIERFPHRRAALDAERAAIDAERPRYNGGERERVRVVAVPIKYSPPSARPFGMAEKEYRDWAITADGENTPALVEKGVWAAFTATEHDMFRLHRASRRGDIVYHSISVPEESKARFVDEGIVLIELEAAQRGRQDGLRDHGPESEREPTEPGVRPAWK